jgi:NitT/TauT family transport system substrate-binding protein
MPLAMMTRRKLMMGALGAAALSASRASANSAPAALLPVRFAYGLSTATFPILYAQEKGLFTKRGLDVKITQFADFDGVYTAFRAGAADIGSGGLASLVNLRGNGVPIKVAWGGSKMSNDILVPAKSGVSDPKELKGKKIGIFGGAAGTTANMFMAIMTEDFGFDPRAGAEIRFGAPGLLAGLMGRGEIAAFVSNDPITAIELASGRAVSIGELSQIYADKHGGYRPHAGAFAVTDAFQQAHPDAIGAFVGAWLEAIQALANDPSLWLTMLKERLHIDDAATAKLLRERVTVLFPTEWTEKNIKGEIESLKFMNKTAGKGFLDRIPDDVFMKNVVPN